MHLATEVIEQVSYSYNTVRLTDKRCDRAPALKSVTHVTEGSIGLISEATFSSDRDLTIPKDFNENSSFGAAYNK